MNGNLFDQSKWRQLRHLRPRQASAIEAIRQAVREGHKRIIVQAPTGFGKTLLSAHLIHNSVEKGKRPLFTCPAITLVNQTLESFEFEGLNDIGVIQAQHERTDWSAQIQIASVQTLIRRALPEVDFVIVDEVHLQFDKLHERLDSDEWKNKIVIGLSATPWAKGMGLRWTKLVIAATVSELIEEGFLSPFIIYAPAVDADFSKLKVKMGEFTEASASAVMGDREIVANVVKTWQEKGQNRSTFLFAVDCAHAKSLQKEFEQANIPCGYIDAFSDADSRKVSFDRFRDRRDLVISSVGCLTTGVDEDVRCIIDAAPTKSELRHVQKIGRGLRTAPGKEMLIILDHAGNTMRLGSVTDIYHDHLDVRTPGEKGEAFADDPEPPKPKKCRACHMVIPSKCKVCPNCGAEMSRPNTVEQREGELVEMGSAAQRKAAKQTSMFDKQEFYSGFLTLATQRGKKEGWAAYRYKERFGVWPNQLKKECGPVSLEVESFDKHCRIKFVKGKQAAEKQVAPEVYAGEF